MSFTMCVPNHMSSYNTMVTSGINFGHIVKYKICSKYIIDTFCDFTPSDNLRKQGEIVFNRFLRT